MKRLVELDLPIQRREVPLQDAIDYFEKENHLDKVKLLRNRKKDYLVALLPGRTL